VVFVHGFGTSSRDFLANLPAAAAAGHRALAFDFLGLGGSAPADAAVAARVGVAVWRDQLAAAIDAVAPGRVYLVGNSLGGLVAAAVAAARPGRVAGCVLLSPAPFWATLPRNRASLALLQVFWGRLTRRAVVEDTLRLVYADGAKVPPAAVEEILAPTAQPYAQAVFEAVLTRGAGELSAGFECIVREAFSEGGGGVPLAIVYGREDPWVVPLFGLRVKGIVPGCAHFELSPCGHCAHAEAPAAVNAIVERWVRDVDGGGNGHGLVEDGEVLEGVRVSVRDGSAGNIFERFAGSSNFGTVFLAAYASSCFAAAGSATER
jgi:pimeloyl-ACP methyl ester carboxylesterase